MLSYDDYMKSLADMLVSPDADGVYYAVMHPWVYDDIFSMIEFERFGWFDRWFLGGLRHYLIDDGPMASGKGSTIVVENTPEGLIAREEWYEG